MGLAGPKKRTKLSHDPNNNNWARDTKSFGHKILSSQGWKPGETLGAKDAAHSSHYTKASNSHIRVLLKDDNLGLGASLAGNRAETFGLSLFSGILGRLNGKAEVDMEKEERKQKDVELALYQGRKYGSLNFVSAGYLVGDKIEKSMSTRMSENKPASTVEPQAATSPSKKRKRSGPDTAEEVVSESDSTSDDDVEPESSRKPGKSEKSTKAKKDMLEEESITTKEKDKKRTKDKKRKASDGSSSEEESRAERKVRRAERRARKEERRRRKEAKRVSKTATPFTAPATPAEPADEIVEVVAVKKEAAAPAATPFIGRHAVRQRYIAQKRLASLNPQALKEVCIFACV